MRDTYFNIKECTNEELEQLKYSVFYDIEEDYMKEFLTDKQIETLNNCEYPEDIPFEILEAIYDGIDFVEDDFWCNTVEFQQEKESFNEEYRDLILEQQNGLI